MIEDGVQRRVFEIEADRGAGRTRGGIITGAAGGARRGQRGRRRLLLRGERRGRREAGQDRPSDGAFTLLATGHRKLLLVVVGVSPRDRAGSIRGGFLGLHADDALLVVLIV